MLFVQLRYNHHARQHEFICKIPNFFSLNLNTFDTIDDHNAAVRDATSRPRVRNERRISRRVDQIDFGFLVFEVGERGVKRDLAGN